MFSLFVLAGAGSLLTGCRKDAGELSSYNEADISKYDTVRVYNLLRDVSVDAKQSGYVLYCNDSAYLYRANAATQAVTYGAPLWLPVPSAGGTFRLKLAVYGANDTPDVHQPDPARVMFEKTIEIPAQSGTSNLVLYDNNGKPDASYIPVNLADPGAPAPGKFKIRVVNFGYAMTGNGYSYPENSTRGKYDVALQLADSTVLPGMENIPFGTASGYYEHEFGQHQFLLYNKQEKRYLNNAGLMNDMVKTFNLYPLNLDINWNVNRLFPSVGTIYDFKNTGNVMYNNIASYPFAAGGCYTMLIIGNIYAVYQDHLYGAGVLDDFGKIQVVNTNPNQQLMDVDIVAGDKQTKLTSLGFGQSAAPVMVKAGPVSVRFTSNGNVVHTYNMVVPRLSNYTLYYISELNGLPTVLPVFTPVSDRDYIYATEYAPPVVQMNTVGTLNLSPDAGDLFFTDRTFDNQYVEKRMHDGKNMGYKQTVDIPKKSYSGVLSPSEFVARFSTLRNDTLASKIAAVLEKPFTRTPSPGTYTLAVAGLLNTYDKAKRLRLILVKHSNIIP